MNDMVIWDPSQGITIPSNIRDHQKLVSYANSLSVKQKQQIINAFDNDAFDMASEYAWKKAMVKLKETLATLGMGFLGEILKRDDINELDSAVAVLTDYTAIQLAEQLGVINKTAALKLRHSNELISHYFSKDASEEIDYHEAIGIVKSSIQYILGEQDISVAIAFSNFRDRLHSEVFSEDDAIIEQLAGSAIFYIRTTITILLSAIKSDNSVKVYNSLANLNVLIEKIWHRIAEDDKWNIGMAYRDAVAAGRTQVSNGLRSVLMKVGGFDFVPENLRSNAFIKAARHVVETHFATNNFYNEPVAISRLASLGTVIPAPAFSYCMQAYLCVYIGNQYGVSRAAIAPTKSELKKITKERWIHYFDKIIHSDAVTLSCINTDSQIKRFAGLIDELNLNISTSLSKENKKLFNAIVDLSYKTARNQAQYFLSKSQ